MGPYFVEFDDSLPNPPRINSQVWFHRESKVLCSVCDEPYRPHIDRQRYCYSCNKWYHVDCLKPRLPIDPEDPAGLVDFHETTNNPIDIEKLEEDNLPEVFWAVLAGPTVRGHYGSYEFGNNWLNTGSGVQKALIAEWMEEGTCPESWMKLLGENFLTDFLVGISWKFYDCPACHLNI
jgi:hypothetical protein